MLDTHGLNVNTPNSNLRRSSCISVANEIHMNQIAKNLQNIRNHGSCSTFDSTDSESDVDDDYGRGYGDKRKSTTSMLSAYSQRYNNHHRKQSRAVLGLIAVQH